VSGRFLPSIYMCVYIDELRVRTYTHIHTHVCAINVHVPMHARNPFDKELLALTPVVALAWHLSGTYM
jgi:hypothetical protein